MTGAMQEFQQRMRSDRAFRQRILAARKAGTLDMTLAQAGYMFDVSSLVAQLPQVRTGIRAGVNSRTNTDCGADCYCII